MATSECEWCVCKQCVYFVAGKSTLYAIFNAPRHQIISEVVEALRFFTYLIVNIYVLFDFTLILFVFFFFNRMQVSCQLCASHLFKAFGLFSAVTSELNGTVFFVSFFSRHKFVIRADFHRAMVSNISAGFAH